MSFTITFEFKLKPDLRLAFEDGRARLPVTRKSQRARHTSAAACALRGKLFRGWMEYTAEACEK